MNTLRTRSTTAGREANAALAARLIEKELRVVAGPPGTTATDVQRFDPDRLDRYGLSQVAA